MSIIAFLTSYSLISVLVFDFTRSQDIKAPCRLVWTPFSIGLHVPPTSVIIDDSSQDFPVYHIRAHLAGNTYVGMYDPGLELPLLPIKMEFDNTTDPIILDILTNPHECNLTWFGSSWYTEKNSLWVETNKSSSTFVGRIRIDEEFLGGQIHYDDVASYISVGLLNEDGNGTVVEEYDSGFQYLCGYSDGMELHLIQIEFEEDPFGGYPDFVGIDEIHNLANTLVTQRVTHRKSIRQETTITITETWTTTTTKTVTINLIFYKKTKTETHTVSHSISNSYTTIEETDIEVMREIRVAPETRVQACSTVTMKKGSEVNYNAIAMYRSRGLGPEELLQIVKSEIKGVQPWIEGGDVYFEMSDKITYSMAMSSNFVVVPYEAINGCSALQKDISRQERIRRGVFNELTASKDEL